MRTHALPLICTLVVACGGVPESAERAQRLYAAGDYAGAGAAADAGLETSPREPALWRIKLRAALGAGDHPGALSIYREWRAVRGGDDPEALRTWALTTLWQSLQVPSGEIRARAIGIVERHELEELADEVAALIAAPDDLVAAAAARALLTSHPQAPRVAVDLLRSEDARARALVVRGIGDKVGVHARADLVPMLADPDPAVRLAAVAAVADFDDERDTEALARAAGDADERVRARALRALVGRAGAAEIARAHLDDDYLGARLAAVAALAGAGESAIPELERLAAGSDPSVALRAAAALAELGAEPPPAVFERAAADPQWTVRVAALNAASEAAPDHLALTLAGRALVDGRAEVRLAAARLLRARGLGERAAAEFTRALADPRADVRLAAATDLARRDHAGAVEILAELAASPRPEVRDAALSAHRAAGVLSPGLVAALAHESTDVRLTAADIVLDVTARD